MGGSPPPASLATPMLQVRKTREVFANFSRGFWLFPTKFQLFKKQYCSRAKDREIFEDLRLRGQGQGLDLRSQGQGLQNVSSRPRTFSRTPPLLIDKSCSSFVLTYDTVTNNKVFISGLAICVSLSNRFSLKLIS